MNKFILREIANCDIPQEIEKIGFDSCYVDYAKTKFEYKNIKIYNLSPAQANILKQTALSIGADCATHRDVITGNIKSSNVIIGGSLAQLSKISEKLTKQPFGLKNLSEEFNKILIPQNRYTKLVGILNITDNSFSDGGKYLAPSDAEHKLLELIEDGSNIIDIGAESTKPYSNPVDSKTQIERIKPILNFIQNENIKIKISLDTRLAEVAEFGLDNGVSIINDVSGFDFDSKMPEVIAKYNAEVIIQHSNGTPDIMQNSPTYNDTIEDIYINLYNKINFAKEKGINKIIVDPGIGFGKTKNDNFKILNRVDEFFTLNTPIMIGLSRKSLLGVIDNDNELKDTLSAAISYPLIKKGVDYLRVHNVKLHKKLLEYNNQGI